MLTADEFGGEFRVGLPFFGVNTRMDFIVITKLLKYLINYYK